MKNRDRISFTFDILIPIILMVAVYSLCFLATYHIVIKDSSLFVYEGLSQGQFIEKAIADILFIQIPIFHFFGTAIMIFYRGLLSGLLTFLFIPIGIIIGLVFFIYQIVKRISLIFKYLRQQRRDSLLERYHQDNSRQFKSISLDEYLEKNNMTIEDLED